MNIQSIINTYVNQVWMRYLDFGGRTDRRSYWTVMVCHAVVLLLLGIAGGILRIGEWTMSVYNLAIAIPSLAIVIRRLRDTNHGWFWIFISIVPVVGPLILLVFMCLPSAVASGSYNGTGAGYGSYQGPTDYVDVEPTRDNDESSSDGNYKNYR